MNEIGLFIHYKADTVFEERVSEAVSIGAECCQVAFWDPTLYTDENAARINKALVGKKFRISALWAGWSGPCEWNFTGGPITIGLVPEKYREMRKKELLAASEFAKKIGVEQIITHVGFLPNDPNDPGYIGTVSALREVVEVMRARIADINPDCRVVTHQVFYTPENADDYDLSAYNYIVDAIDTISAKVELICRAKAAGTPIICAMGAGNKLDPSAFRVADLSKTQV